MWHDRPSGLTVIDACVNSFHQFLGTSFSCWKLLVSPTPVKLIPRSTIGAERPGNVAVDLGVKIFPCVTG